MRAAILRGIGQRVSVESAADPRPGAGESVVRLAASALNHRDVWIRKGQYAGLKFPIILGSDGVGEVVEIGEGGDRSLLGRKAVINPSLSWGSSQAHQAEDFRILGLPDDGTFAQYVKVPAANLHPKPDSLSDHEAAALPLSGLTAYRALFSRGNLKLGENVLITGVGGGTASLAVQFASAAGGRVFVTSGSNEKLESAEELGALGGVNYNMEGWERRLLDQAEGFDLIVDCAGGSGFLKLFELAKPGGRIVVFGATAGNPPELPMRRIFWKQLSLLGTSMGSPADFASMLEFVCDKRIRARIDSVFSLERTNDAFDRMEMGGQYGKIVLEIATL